MTSYEQELQSLELELLERDLARSEFADFVPQVRPGYDMQWFHRTIADKLQLVYERKIKKLMLFVPPQHGKSELSTRSFPAWVLGKDPNQKIAVASYSATVASKFNRDIKPRMESRRYGTLFPETVLGNGKNGYTNNNDIFEVAGKDGFVYTVGVGGALTSVTVDLGIIDDPVKDRQAASSPTIRESTWDWYVDVFETRLHNNSAQCLIQTRWNQDDLGGRLLKRDGIYSASNPNGWVVVSFPALRTRDVNDFDPRAPDEALWPDRHSQEKIEKIKAENSITFNSLYQQDPKPSPDSLVYADWIEIPEFPLHLRSTAGVAGDFGYTNDPTAVAMVAREGNRLYVDELIYKTGLTNPAILQYYHALKLGTARESIWDKAEPKSITELQRGALIQTAEGVTKLPGINAKGSDKGPGSIEAGISKVNEFQVYYTARSLNLKTELTNYQYIMHNGVSTNVPVDEFNHLLDAIRGYVFTKYGRPARQFGGAVNK